MSRKNKLAKFSDMLEFPNVVENFDFMNPQLILHAGTTVDFRGQWKSQFFKNNNPLILELACGRGEYTVGLAQLNPNTNYLGVDIKGARIWKGAKQALELELNNAKFLRTRIEQIHLFFDEKEVDEIWITFPDPFHSKERNRLTHPKYLDLYKKILKPNGIIHLKTDDELLYESSLEFFNEYSYTEILYHTANLYSSEYQSPEFEIKTYYEKSNISKGDGIRYVKVKMVG